jgi:hypothetical protein
MSDLVSQKIRVLRHEGKPQAQAVAMAINMNKAGRLRKGGVYVHAKRKMKKSLRHCMEC